VFEPVLHRAARGAFVERVVRAAALGVVCSVLWAISAVGPALFPEPDAVAPPWNPVVTVMPDLVQPPRGREGICRSGYLDGRVEFTPDPSADALRRTRLGRKGKGSVRLRMRYCFDSSGEVSSAKVVSRSRHAPEAEAVVLDTVRQWWLDPEVVEVPSECNVVDFVLEFE
jgi:hypothetical protein